MGQRVEWMDAEYTTFQVVEEGEPLGDSEVSAPLAVSISADEMTVVEGSLESLFTLIDGTRSALLQHAPVCTVCGRRMIGGQHV